MLQITFFSVLEPPGENRKERGCTTPFGQTRVKTTVIGKHKLQKSVSTFASLHYQTALLALQSQNHQKIMTSSVVWNQFLLLCPFTSGGKLRVDVRFGSKISPAISFHCLIIHGVLLFLSTTYKLEMMSTRIQSLRKSTTRIKSIAVYKDSERQVIMRLALGHGCFKRLFINFMIKCHTQKYTVTNF